MELVRKMDWNDLQHEYGLDGTRLLPWEGLSAPFGGAYCVVAGGSTSLDHVNMPADEEELFIAICGKATVVIGDASYKLEKGDVAHIPAGTRHYVENSFDEDFHFYTIWWNSRTVQSCSDTFKHIKPAYEHPHQ